MRLLLATSLLALLAGAAATQSRSPQAASPQAEAAQPSAKPVCLNRDNRQAMLPATPPRPRRLDELPSGNLERAVQREVDGCIEPVIVRYDFARSRR